nr:hypothetical protein [Tanacetum cinerariifolium]
AFDTEAGYEDYEAIGEDLHDEALFCDVLALQRLTDVVFDGSTSGHLCVAVADVDIFADSFELGLGVQTGVKQLVLDGSS